MRTWVLSVNRITTVIVPSLLKVTFINGPREMPARND